MMEPDNRWDTYLSEQRRIERREAQLWRLAILIIVLLALAVSVIDLSNALHTPASGPLSSLDSQLMRYFLIAATFLICAYFRDSARRLRKLNHHLLEDLRGQASLAERRNYELARLKDISDHLIGNLDMRNGLDLIIGMAMDISGAQSASILLLDEFTGKLDRLSARSISLDGSPRAESLVKPNIAQWVVDRGRAVLLNPESDEPELADGPELAAGPPTVLAPISAGGRTLGVLAVVGKASGGQFTNEDLDTISTLASQVGLVIEKMHLYRKLQDQVVRLRSALQELREAQAGLIHNEKLAAIGQLAGGMAHEINNPLLVILGRAEMLLMGMDAAEPQAKDLEIIRSETERIASIVRNLLSFSRIERSGMPAPIDINEVIERTLELVTTQEHSAGVEIIKRLASEIPPVYAEAGEIQQVFMNIAINACQAMKESGGKLIVETSQDDMGYVVAKFADTGPGIAPEHLGQIFEPFFTTKPDLEGTGLGLPVSRGIVEKYGGRIEVETRLGDGANFIVKLPQADESILDLPKAA